MPDYWRPCGYRLLDSTAEGHLRVTDAFLRRQEDRTFENAISQTSTTPTSRRTYTPTPKDQIPVPWYLDPESGGPNPAVKKPGIQYDDDVEFP